MSTVISSKGVNGMRRPKMFSGARSAIGVGIVFVALSFAHPLAAHAETPSQFIASLGESAIHTMVDEGLTDEERIGRFRELLVDRFDLPLIGRYVLGVHWRRASPEQRIEFSGLFEEYLVGIYASGLGRYGGESLSVKSTHAVGKDTIVTTEVHGLPRNPTLRVDWRIRRDTDNYKVVDIIVEGVSLMIIQRDQFASVIQRTGGDVEGLLAELREKSLRE